jgi:hypothetical protein
MATLPTVPSFVANDSSLTKLQQLSGAVDFLVNTGTRPILHIYKVSASSITASTWTTVPGGTIAYDSDNMTGGSATFAPTIKTQGYYSFEGCAQWATGTTGIFQRVSFLFTAGSGNPNFTLGTTVRFGLRGGNSTTTAANDTVQCTTAVSPMGLYVNDTVAMQVWTDVTTNILNNSNVSYISGRFVLNLTAFWLRTAP